MGINESILLDYRKREQKNCFPCPRTEVAQINKINHLAYQAWSNFFKTQMCSVKLRVCMKMYGRECAENKNNIISYFEFSYFVFPFSEDTKRVQISIIIYPIIFICTYIALVHVSKKIDNIFSLSQKELERLCTHSNECFFG